MVAFDASFLILMLDEEAAANQGTPRLGERIDLLLDQLSKSRSKILIPTPALSEFLAKADVAILDKIHATSSFVIAPFDERAAIEAAEMTKNSIRERDKKDPVFAGTWSKIKFDRQIVAIAKVEGVDAIYSTDPDVEKHAKKVGLPCYGIVDLPSAPSVQLPLKPLDEQ
jgi:predicted nucleic acid-binding protein